MPNPIFDAAIELQLDIARTSTSIEKDVLALLIALQKELIAKVAAGDFTAASKKRIDRQLADVEKLIAGYYTKASTIVAEASPAIAQVSALATRQSLTVGAAIAAMPSQAMLEAIASQSVIQGAAQGAWWAKQSADTAFRFGQAIRQGLVAGETNQQIIARVRAFMDVRRRDAAALVQTSVATVANDARQAVYEANDDIIKRYRAIETLDSHTCIECFPAGTIVRSAGDAKHVFRGKYRGDIAVITTAAGKKLRGTPNHPVLTSRGFLPIAEIKPFDKVLNVIFHDRFMPVRNNSVKVPSEISAFFNFHSELSASDVRRVAASANDFYGDGHGIDGKVDIVPTDSNLRGDTVSTGLDSVPNPRFCSVEDSCRLSGFDHLDDLLLRVLCFGLTSKAPAASFKDGVNAGLGLSGCGLDHVGLHALIEKTEDHLSVCDDVRLAITALHMRHNAMLLQEACDGGGGGGILDGKGASRSAFSVFFDDVVSCETELGDCHVYTLEDSLGFYIAEGMIVKNCAAADSKEYTKDFKPIGHSIAYKPAPRHFNCRGLYIPVVFDGPQGGQRASADGPIPASDTFSDWLERQPPAKVDDILGKGRADLYRSGKLTLTDLVSGRGKPLSLAALQSKYA